MKSTVSGTDNQGGRDVSQPSSSSEAKFNTSSAYHLHHRPTPRKYNCDPFDKTAHRNSKIFNNFIHLQLNCSLNTEKPLWIIAVLIFFNQIVSTIIFLILSKLSIETLKVTKTSTVTVYTGNRQNVEFRLKI